MSIKSYQGHGFSLPFETIHKLYQSQMVFDDDRHCNELHLGEDQIVKVHRLLSGVQVIVPSIGHFEFDRKFIIKMKQIMSDAEL